jgi:hypothetical protein
VEVIERAIERGEVRPDIPVTAVVHLIGSLVSMRAITGQDMPTHDDVERLVEFVLNGIST